MAKVKDYYQILGVNPDARVDEIQKAFIQRGDEAEKSGNAEQLSDLQEAFKVLSNPKRRKLYDEYLEGAPTTAELRQMAYGATAELPTNGTGAKVQTQATVQRWEYLTLRTSTNYNKTKYYINDDLQTDLKNAEFPDIINQLGSDGWEMVGISTFEKEQTFIFKRPTNKKFAPTKKGPAA